MNKHTIKSILITILAITIVILVYLLYKPSWDKKYIVNDYVNDISSIQPDTFFIDSRSQLYTLNIKNGSLNNLSISINVPKISSKFSPNGSLIAISGNGDGFIVKHVNSGRTILDYQGERADYDITDLSWSQNNRFLALLVKNWKSYQIQDEIHIWDVEGRRKVQTLVGFLSPLNESYSIQRIALNSTGSLLASTDNGALRIWDVANRRVITQIEPRQPEALAWSHQGALLAIGASIWRFDGTTLQPIHTLNGPQDVVNVIAWSADDQWLAAGTGQIHEPSGAIHDTAIYVWRTNDGKHTMTLSGHDAIVSALAWSPEMQRLLSGDSKGTILVWTIE